MKYKREICLLLIFLQLFFLSACGIDNNSNNINEEDIELEDSLDAEPVYGGKLVVPIAYSTVFNPLLKTDKFTYNFNKLIFEGLFDVGDNLKIENVLVDDYNFDEDGLVLNLKLKENIKWHDGEEFTTEDVKFTIDTLKYALSDAELKESLSANVRASKSLELLSEIEVSDKYNISLIFKQRYGDLLGGLIFPIIPKHVNVVDNRIDNAYQNALNEFENQIIGTGPYKLIEYARFKNVTLESFEDYWGEKPFITKIIGKAIKDEELATIAFESGQIDLTTGLGVDWEKYTQNKNVNIFEYPSNQYEFLGFNFREGIFTGEKGKALRKAIAYAIDRQSIIQKVYLGHATRNDVPIHPSSWLLSDEANSYGHNMDKARQILIAAGWNDTDGDGYFEDVDGNDLSIRFITNSYNNLRMETANLITQNLNDLGIRVVKEYNDVSIDNLTEEMIDEQWQNMMNKINSGSFDMVLLGWNLSYNPDLTFAFHSNQIDEGLNFIGYNNEKMDNLLSLAADAYSEEDKLRIYEEIQSLIIDDLPYISLFFVNSSLLVNKKFYGNLAPNAFNLFEDIEKWYIPEQLQEKDKVNN